MTYPYRSAPNCDVLGAGISAIFNHRRRDDVLESLIRHQADYLEPDAWYPIEKFIQIFEEWSALPDCSANCISVGMAMIYHLDLPPEMEHMTTEQRLLALGDLHLMYQRGDVGVYEAQAVGPRHIIYSENTIWPDDMIYGYLYGAAQHFLPDGTRFMLSYDATQPRQATGGPVTIFHLTWD